MPDNPEFILDQYQEALRLWLSWDSREREIMAAFYNSKGDPTIIKELADSLDEVRARAVKTSKELLDRFKNND